MKTLMNTILIAGVLVLGTSPGAIAQDKHEEGQKLSNEGERVVLQDKLKADLRTPADKKDKEIYHRTLTANNEGTFDAVITDEKGQLRMQGRYLDEQAQVADGQFTFYYPNGNVESSGLYVNGVKSGTWSRYADDGTPKAERNYTGMTWEDMAVMLGVAAQAEVR